MAGSHEELARGACAVASGHGVGRGTMRGRCRGTMRIGARRGARCFSACSWGQFSARLGAAPPVLLGAGC